MPRYARLLPLALAACLSGCLTTDGDEKAALVQRMQQNISSDFALIEIALLERPLGDSYINDAIWGHTDELIGGDEERDARAENGLRVGQLVGLLPRGFQELLLSKRCCTNPKALVFPAERAVPIYLGAVLPTSSYQFVKGKSRTDVFLDQARYCLTVTARFTSDGKTTLTFTPKVENGAPTLPFRAIPEEFAWEMKVERASKKYPELSWQVTLGPNQYCIVGTRPDREGTLGRSAFTEIDDERSVQRLLVIRNCRAVKASDAQDRSVDELLRLDASPPLALRAAAPTQRTGSK